MPISLLLLFAQGIPARPASPAPLPNVTTQTVFEGEGAPPPLAEDVARAFPFEAKAAVRKPYDPAPLWLDRLMGALGSRPNYVVRDRSIDLAPCDARDMRCQTMHDDLARVEPLDAPVGVAASGIGSALGLLFGGKDREIGGGVLFRGKARFVGVAGAW